MKSRIVLVFFALLLCAKVHGDLLKSYKTSSLHRIPTEEEESKDASEHLFRLRLSKDSADLVPYSCGDRYQSKCQELLIVNTFKLGRYRFKSYALFFMLHVIE